MKVNKKSLHALINLANHFWLHVFRRAFMKPKPGAELKKFRENYAPDRLVPLTPEESALLPEFQKCINCGACAAVCPVCAPAAAGAYRGPDSITAALSRSFPDFGSARDAVYNCTQCGACALACPRGIKIPDLVMLVRRKAVEIADPHIIEQFNPIVEGVAMAGNVYGRCRDDFSAFSNPGAEILFFIGCAGRHRTQDSTLKALGLLKALDVNFTVIDERCCGAFHRSVGIKLEENSTVAENLKNILAARPKKLVTGCPHGFEVFGTCEPYRSEFRKNGIEVIHISEFLAGIGFEVEKTEEKIAYHDPCFLGRRGGVYDAPRALIRRAGAEPVELPQCRENGLCCGSKDGTFIIDDKVAAALAEKRMKQAAEAGAETLLTECPACLAAFRGAGDGKIKIELVSAYLADRVKKEKR